MIPWVPGEDEENLEVSNLSELASTIAKINYDALDRSDLLLANIGPFRGPHMDVGTAFEIGYFFAQKKPVVLYYHQKENVLSDRITQSHGKDDKGYGSQGYLIEDFGWHENLMIENVIHAQKEWSNKLPEKIHFSLQDAIETIIQWNKNN